MRNGLPAGPRLPILASTVRWVARPTQYLEACRRRYGDVFTLPLIREGPWVMVADPELVKQVFTGPPELLHAGEGNAVLRPILGPSSVLVLDEAEHMRQRKLLLPPLHGERIQRYEEVMRAETERVLRSWPTGVAAAARPRTQQVTLEVIMRAVFGATGASELGRLRVALEGLLELTTRRRRLILLVVMGPDRVRESQRLGFRDALERVDSAVLDLVRARRADPALEDRDDILSLLLQATHEDGSPMSDSELRDELLTLLVAGHETTATALAWALELLVRHPDALERARADGDYLEAVIRETLRLRPVIALVARKLTADWTLGDHHLPAGAVITPCIYLIHRREDVYPEADRFRPERFLETPPGTYTWIPFGGGVRRCLGASFALFEMEVVLDTLLQHARVRAARSRPERVARRAITLTPSRGGEVVLEPF
jgi:cytochrome P450 family 135